MKNGHVAQLSLKTLSLFPVLFVLVSISLTAKDLLQSQGIAAIFQQIHDRDNHKINAPIYENGNGDLFRELGAQPHESYQKTIELADQFNPKNKTNDHNRLRDEIDEYVEYLGQFETIQYALEATDTDLNDLRKNWFGHGRGFEHTLNGEIKGTKVGGYHWWYRYFVDQQDGKVEYVKTKKGASDQNIFAGSFKWDPDGNGPLPNAYKSFGGFTVGHSAHAMMALGHVAMEFAKRNGKKGGFVFEAPFRGKSYYWQVYTMGGSLRSFYAKAPNGRNIQSRDALFDIVFAQSE